LLTLLALLTLLIGAAGCSDDASCPTPTTEVSLIDHAKWQKVELKDDPWAANLPAEATCGAGAFKAEAGALEFDTGVCNFITLQQPSQAAVESCDELRIVFWHLPLYAGPKGADALAELRLGEHSLLKVEKPIPPEGAIEASFTPKHRLNTTIAAGTPIRIHVQNHGLNTWKLLSAVAAR